MRVLLMCGLQFMYWTALSVLPNFVKDERMLLAAFAATLVVSMVTASTVLVRRAG